MKSICVILVSYHAGIARIRFGLGPEAILATSLAVSLESIRKTVTTKLIEPVDDFEGEIGRSFGLMRRASRALASALDDEAFPNVLVGNCNTETGVTAGVASKDLRITCVDAHFDLDSANQITSGYFDGMVVSMLMSES